jgi:hypothetical protein
LPELRREFFAAAHSTRSYAGEASGFDEAGGENWRVFGVGFLT